jgi:hypothetical protein
MKPLDSRLNRLAIELDARKPRHVRQQLLNDFAVHSNVASDDFTARGSLADFEFSSDEVIESQAK